MVREGRRKKILRVNDFLNVYVYLENNLSYVLVSCLLPDKTNIANVFEEAPVQTKILMIIF